MMTVEAKLFVVATPIGNWVIGQIVPEVIAQVRWSRRRGHASQPKITRPFGLQPT